jgi:peptidoglycan/LPS O-acetylase OafA/YrhL
MTMKLTWRSDAAGDDGLARGRVVSLDVLKVVMVVMVIVHHAGQPYGPTGGFWPIQDSVHAAVLGPFFAINASFGMALFFLISGYFVPPAFDRKGARAFLRDRFARLGVPLVSALLMFTPFLYADYARSASRGTGAVPYMLRTLFGAWHLGHLWFLADLLAFVSVYVAWRAVVPSPVRERVPSAPSHGAILGFTLALAAVTFVVRLWSPIDRWIALLGVLPVEPAHLLQYASWFLVGVVAHRHGWLEATPFRVGVVWLVGALVGAALCFVLPVWSGGGPSTASLLWSIWETFLATGFCIGLVVFFHRFVRAPGRLVAPALPLAFGAYVVHVAPVTALQVALRGVALPALVKFAIVSALGVPLSFLLASGVPRLRASAGALAPTGR